MILVLERAERMVPAMVVTSPLALATHIDRMADLALSLQASWPGTEAAVSPSYRATLLALKVEIDATLAVVQRFDS